MNIINKQLEEFDKFWLQVKNKEFADNQLKDFLKSSLEEVARDERKRIIIRLNEYPNNCSGCGKKMDLKFGEALFLNAENGQCFECVEKIPTCSG